MKRGIWELVVWEKHKEWVSQLTAVLRFIRTLPEFLTPKFFIILEQPRYSLQHFVSLPVFICINAHMCAGICIYEAACGSQRTAYKASLRNSVISYISPTTLGLLASKSHRYSCLYLPSADNSDAPHTHF